MKSKIQTILLVTMVILALATWPTIVILALDTWPSADAEDPQTPEFVDLEIVVRNPTGYGVQKLAPDALFEYEIYPRNGTPAGAYALTRDGALFQWDESIGAWRDCSIEGGGRISNLTR